MKKCRRDRACFGSTGGGGGRIRIASQAFIALQVIKSVVSWSFYAPYTHTPLVRLHRHTGFNATFSQKKRKKGWNGITSYLKRVFGFWMIMRTMCSEYYYFLSTLEHFWDYLGYALKRSFAAISVGGRNTNFYDNPHISTISSLLPPPKMISNEILFKLHYQLFKNGYFLHCTRCSFG